MKAALFTAGLLLAIAAAGWVLMRRGGNERIGGGDGNAFDLNDSGDAVFGGGDGGR